MSVIVIADRAHREAARAVAEGADDPQQSLPEAEEVAGAQRRLSFLVRQIEILIEELGDLRESELLRLGGTSRLVQPPLPHGVRRTGMQAAAARFPDAHLLLHALVGLELELGEDAGQIEARAELGRQD